MANHYATLCVPRDAARDEIVRAYRRLARTHHPDVGGDTDRFRAVQAAYEILGDPKLRLLYDLELDRLAPKPPPAQPAGPARPRAHRYAPAPVVTLPPPSAASSVTAVVLVAAAVVASALPALLVLGPERRIGPALLSLLVGCSLAACARALAATQLDRAQRFRMLWAYGFALPDTGAEVGLARCCRLAATARVGSRLVLRGAFAVCAFVALALAPGSVLP